MGYLIHRRMRRPPERVQVREVRRVLGVAVLAPEGRSGSERMLQDIGGQGMGVEIV